MSKRISRRTIVLGLLASSVNFGCGTNPFLIPEILFGGREARSLAEFPFKVQPKHEDAKVVVLVSSKPGLPSDLSGADRKLNVELMQVLDARLKENEEKVQVLKMPKIDEYKSEHPNWRSAHPYDIGKNFSADYVVDVEIIDMDLYKPNSQGQWLQGRAAISVNAYDLSKSVRDPAFHSDYNVEFPKGREIEVENRSQISGFYQKFVSRIAFDISLKFTSSTTDHQRTFTMD
ncbi:hypothetical protein [Zavarzinella formosa]|uniref:hypothetical protein n=1 Tax=Zavarzinella formosa TaxID=360055 RepID=UPI0012F896A0|nr:hypothetical protein [Zavarzinella formosa]